MGNDGGSIPTRRELVKNAARQKNTTELKATQLEAQTHAWTYCPLSNRPLVAPIVSDNAGTLYNKDAILEQLLPNNKAVPAIVIKEKEDILHGRVKSLRDVVEVGFTIAKDGRYEKQICPITSKELGPSTKAVYLVPCGHAFSEAAIRELSADACVKCNEPYILENIIPILPLTKEDNGKLAARARKLKEAGLTHSLKKAPGGKKRKKNIKLESGEPATVSEARNDNTTKAKDGPTENVEETNSGAGIKNSVTASLTARVLDEQTQRNKRQKMGLNDNLKTLFSSARYDPAAQNGGDFMTRGYTLPKKAQ
ncbi:Rtf2 RING-finger-domain-containing protein [Bisporella sp. PMI_857]|nr:Rtf2 RING-finger-domain-containing protein [Bisporella sp. PMI_857]